MKSQFKSKLVTAALVLAAGLTVEFLTEQKAQLQTRASSLVAVAGSSPTLDAQQQARFAGLGN